MSERVVVWLIAAFFLVLAVAAAVGKHHARAEFLNECTQDRKFYECEALWRADDSFAVPILIPVL